jgi:hypothetical protein
VNCILKYLKVIFTPIIIRLRARKPRRKLRLAEEISRELPMS